VSVLRGCVGDCPRRIRLTSIVFRPNVGEAQRTRTSVVPVFVTNGQECPFSGGRNRSDLPRPLVTNGQECPFSGGASGSVPVGFIIRIGSGSARRRNTSASCSPGGSSGTVRDGRALSQMGTEGSSECYSHVENAVMLANEKPSKFHDEPLLSPD